MLNRTAVKKFQNDRVGAATLVKHNQGCWSVSAFSHTLCHADVDQHP